MTLTWSLGGFPAYPARRPVDRQPHASKVRSIESSERHRPGLFRESDTSSQGMPPKGDSNRALGSGARPYLDLGRAPDQLILRRIQLVLARSTDQEEALSSLLERQQERRSPDFHHWISPVEFGKKFGPSDAQVEALTRWAQEMGFLSIRVNSGRTVAELSGSVAAVQSAFSTEIRRASWKGDTYFYPSVPPVVPRELTSLVAGVASLGNLPTAASAAPDSGVTVTRGGEPPSDIDANFTYASEGATKYAIGPYDFAAIYDVNPLWAAAAPLDGSGIPIAVVGNSDISAKDFLNFRTLFSLPLGSTNTQTGTQYLNIIYAGVQPAFTSGEFQAASDTQWAAAVAKGSTILYVAAETTESTAGDALAAEYTVDNDLAPILLDSYSTCELTLGTSGNLFYNKLWQQAAAEGITVITSTGDSGVAACDASDSAPATLGNEVNGIASTTYDVAVGGTEFYLPNGPSPYFNPTNSSTNSSATGYIPEMVWNDTCTSPAILSTDPFQGMNAEQACNSKQAAAGKLDILLGGGGGPSRCITGTAGDPSSCSGGYAKPTWQLAPGVPADGVRDVPDVSFFASKGGDGVSYAVCENDLDPGKAPCSLASPYVDFLSGGGTNIASAAFAGVMAIVEQSTGQRIGNPNYILYQLASQQSGSACSTAGSPACIFHDIQMGTNAMVCITGSAACVTNSAGDAMGILPSSQAGAGFDLGSGLGSVDVSNLVSAWPAPPATKANALLSISPSSVTHGAPVQATVTVTGNSPTGQISLNAEAANGFIGSGALSNQTFTATFRNFPGGSYGLRAYYSGDENNAPVYSNYVSLDVAPEQSNSNMSVVQFDPASGTSTAASSVPYGSNIFVRDDVSGTSGQGTATGQVSITDNAQAFGAVIYPLNPSGYTEAQITYLGVGKHLFSGAYSGDQSFKPSQSNSAPLTVTAAPTVASVATSASTVSSDGVLSLTAMIGSQSYSTSAAPSGSVTFQCGNLVLATANLTQGYNGAFRASTVETTITTSSLPLGSDIITVSYPGDVDYLPSSVQTGPILVTSSNLVATRTSLVVTPAVLSKGNSILSFTATVSPNSPPLGGSVQFLVDGGLYGPLVPLSSNGSASYSGNITGLSYGQHTAMAIYTGNASADSSSASPLVPFVFHAPTSSVTALTLTPTTALLGTFISASAQVSPSSPSPTGTVQLQLDGSAYGNTVSLVNGAATLPLATDHFQVGTYAVRAFYSGDDVYASSISPSVPITIGVSGLAPISVSVSDVPAKIIIGSPLAFTVSMSQSNPMPTGIYQVVIDGGNPGTPILLQGVSQILTVSSSGLSVGSHVLSVNYSGDSHYNLAKSASASFEVTPLPMVGGFSISPTVASISGSNLSPLPTVPFVLTPINGFTSQISFSCSNLPENSSCTFSPSNLTLDGVNSATETFTLNLDTALDARWERHSRWPRGSGESLCATVFFLWLCTPRSRRSMRRPLSLLLLLVCASTLSGCGSGIAPGVTPAGDYHVTVTATGGGMTETAIVNIQIS